MGLKVWWFWGSGFLIPKSSKVGRLCYFCINLKFCTDGYYFWVKDAKSCVFFMSVEHPPILSVFFCLFTYVKIKVMRVTVFSPFFDFHVMKRFFTHSFQENFLDSRKFQRTLFIDFSRVRYSFSQVLFEKKSRIGYYLHGKNCKNFHAKLIYFHACIIALSPLSEIA